jgi:tellurite resistance protein
MTQQPHPLKFIHPGWFSLVMGLCGLALAWHAASGLLGPMASGVSVVLGLLAAAVLGVLVVASLLRWQRHPDALAEDLRHPVRHAFVAALPVGLLLLVTVAVALLGADTPVRPLLNSVWWAAALGQLWVTVWTLGRWFAVPAPGAAPGSLWPAVTPVLLIPVVGNVVVPLPGLPLGHEVWSMVHFGIGVFFWPVVFTLLVVRRLTHSPLPDRLLPAWMITLAPPSVVGVVLHQLGAPLLVLVAVWGVGLFVLLWVGTLAKRIAAQPFGIPFWALSFPLAAFTTLTLRLTERLQGTASHGMAQTGAMVLLAITTIVITWLVLATVRGLRQGTLLAPEPVAQIAPVAS